jgi:hypothetical protein
MQTSSGNGVALLIRPSLATGLYTDTNVSTSNKNSSGISSATADVGIKVCVTVDTSAKNIGPTGDTANNVGGDGCVVYDQRFQQLSTTLFNTITSCGMTTTGAAVPCYIDLIESTLSAHSFDFVAYNLSQGNHTVNVSWSIFGTNNNTAGGEYACLCRSWNPDRHPGEELQPEQHNCVLNQRGEAAFPWPPHTSPAICHWRPFSPVTVFHQRLCRIQTSDMAIWWSLRV